MTSPDIQFKEFSLTKQKKLDLERTMSKVRKPFLKKLDQTNKKTENQFQNAASENKKTTSEKCQSDSNKKLGPY